MIFNLFLALSFHIIKKKKKIVPLTISCEFFCLEILLEWFLAVME